jgi:hypothetical protein
MKSNRAKIAPMAEPGPDAAPQRNLATRRKHRKEVLWQITVPLGIGALLFLAMAVMAGTATSAQASLWADISLIWLISPTFIFGLIALVILFALIYITIRLILVLPFYAYRLHQWLVDFGVRIKTIGDKAVAPVLGVQSRMSSLRALGRSLRRR